MKVILECFKFSIKKSTQYRANLISWVLADISLYSSVFAGYYLLSLNIGKFGDYTKYEILLYISCSFLVNNIYAIFFAEGLGSFCENIINGRFDFVIIKPISMIKFYVFKFINIPALVSTPLLIFLNIYCMRLCNVKISIIYVFSILLGSFTMGMMFFILFSLTLFGVRSEELSSILLQLISVSEKPDTVFPRSIRSFFIYIIPVFLFSAIPARIALNKVNMVEVFCVFIIPIIYYFILKLLLRFGMRKYQSGVE